MEHKYQKQAKKATAKTKKWLCSKVRTNRMNHTSSRLRLRRAGIDISRAQFRGSVVEGTHFSYNTK